MHSCRRIGRDALGGGVYGACYRVRRPLGCTRTHNKLYCCPIYSLTRQKSEPSRKPLSNNATSELRTASERFIDTLDEGTSDNESNSSKITGMQQQLEKSREEVQILDRQLDEVHQTHFAGVEYQIRDGEGSGTSICPEEVTEKAFVRLGRNHPEDRKGLMAAAEVKCPGSLARFQSAVMPLRMRRSRYESDVQRLEESVENIRRQQRADAAQTIADHGSGDEEVVRRKTPSGSFRIVMMTGFESFNVGLYKKAAERVSRQCPGVEVIVFSDRDLVEKRQKVEAALKGADVFFGSLLFDFDQVEWLKTLITDVKVRLVFESALELMGTTKIGTFQMDPSGKSKGPPPAVQKILSMFGSGKEEDKLVGYLSFLKIGPKLLKFLPGKKARDLRNWLTVYGYWNEGGIDNVTTMLLYLVDEYLQPSGVKTAAIQITPPTGCLHPDHQGFFTSPADYLKWYRQHGPLQDAAAPVIAVLLYRKHVITQQPYIEQLVHNLESAGLLPVPIFINGVEAHTIVRDQLTSSTEQASISKGRERGSLRSDAIAVDAVVSTIGFPLVGGPAGTMEGGRQADIAKAILAAKNVPYFVAAPLLIQDMASWSRDGIAGLQSVVLYSLPELDGAIDTVPLGGLVANDIYLSQERVRRLAGRLNKWVALRRSPLKERKVALLLYGFPPNVGATGTAALLNVPRSLEALLGALAEEGYDLGPSSHPIDGEAIIAALQAQDSQLVVSRGEKGIHQLGAGAAELFGARPTAAAVSGRELREMMTFPRTWGSSEWGPIPFLPDPDVLVQRMEDNWGDLTRYRGLATTAAGDSLVAGLQLGNVWIGVQPALGVEGDPMRLLFEKDLTPHPQYVAFYKWLQNGFKADAIVHLGMHGTVEWLPGAPLGNTGLSWPDVLLGDLPNIYVYAANNPSETIIAKRRGYATVVSHNVPPYGRAGLYKQLAELKAMVADVREDPGGVEALKPAIVSALLNTGLANDCPFREKEGDEEAQMLSQDAVSQVSSTEFLEYCSRLNAYLQVLENRLFSEGLHVLGRPPGEEAMGKYLDAFFDGKLSSESVQAVVHHHSDGLSAVRQRLERLLPEDALNGSEERSPQAEESKLSEAIEIADLLARNTEEIDSVLRALNGEYILPEAGGDLLRDGAGVLPTGRNIHALDPYRMPSVAAMQRGAEVAESILQQHKEANDGALPSTVSVNLWGLDAIKTKGESVGIVLSMVGARPLREGTGRIARFELISLEELGRPRVDVLCNMSGIFRDSFQNVVELLDDMFQRAAAADEPLHMNYVRAHSDSIKSDGLENSTARLFSNPAGDYGSMVNERVGTGEWQDGSELGDTWASRNAFSYGRGSERGTARPEVLQALLKSTDRVVQEVDSLEYGLSDIQEYYANTGGIISAASKARGKPVSCSVVEAFGDNPEAKDLEKVLRIEMRSKLLNPKWAKAMVDQGSGGAFEISQRMTTMIGWGGTAGFAEKWAFDQAAETYALDADMAAKLQKSNPQAFNNVVKRLLEAKGRGMWDADSDTVERLQELFAKSDAQLEGI